MSESSHSISSLIGDIRTCLRDRDFDAACFLREGLYESLRYGTGWLSPEEEELLSSY